MIQSLLRRLTSPTRSSFSELEIGLAFAGLLVRVARSDDHYGPDEVLRIRRVLIEQYQLSPSQAEDLHARAEQLETHAPDTVRFTRAIKLATELDDRKQLIQSLWSVALVDGHRSDSEDQFLRLLCDLLGVKDVDSAVARRRAQTE